MARDPLPRVRKLCLGLPEATEKEAWWRPTFRVRSKMFGMYMNNHHDDGRIALWCKAPPGAKKRPKKKCTRTDSNSRTGSFFLLPHQKKILGMAPDPS